ncbi:MAG: hypothetical protein ABSB78_04185 [Bacteroidota bacterium]
MDNSILSAIHPNHLIAVATILCGLIFGFTLALSDWKSKFTIGGIITTVSGSLTSFTGDKVAAVKQFLDGAKLFTPILYGLNIALIVFISSLFLSTIIVFTANFLRNKRINDPEAFGKAARRAFTILGNGLYRYVTAQPDLVAANRIRDLEKHINVLSLMHKTLVSEIRCHQHSVQHFKDSVDAAGRLLLQYSFGDSPELQQFRMAFFEQKGDRLEYMIAINNRDWTSHSMRGFDVNNSFVGQAILTGRPLIYPKDKKFNAPYLKRKSSRYKSFIAVPVPCSQSDVPNIGAITVDYTGKESVFTELRIDELFIMSQLIYVLYILNIQGNKNEKRTKKQ